MQGVNNMLNKRAVLLSVFILLIAVFAAMQPGYGEGDTGTYRILCYKVRLIPDTDGNVSIEYYQKWKVTGGHIPWITVGVPNNDYSVDSCDLAAKQAYPDNNGGDSLVHIDLDKDYQSGETFEIKFSINEQRLFYADGSDYKLDFTPGWYDRALIDSLEIRLKPFVGVSDVVVTPTESSRTDSEIIWTKTGMAEGEHFSIYTSFPKNAATSSIPQSGLQEPESTNIIGPIMAIILVISLIWGIVKLIKVIDSGGYSGGRIYRGGGHSSGCVHSCACACACAGCACACACAGGGGAGCSRKTEHRCKLCAK